MFSSLSFSAMHMGTSGHLHETICTRKCRNVTPTHLLVIPTCLPVSTYLQTQIQIHKYKCTNTQISKYKYANTQIQTQKYKYTNKNTQLSPWPIFWSFSCCLSVDIDIDKRCCIDLTKILLEIEYHGDCCQVSSACCLSVEVL